MPPKKVSMSSASSSSGLDNARPPGPSGLPLMGSKLEWDGPRTNLAWTKKYGPIYQVRMVDKDLVYLNNLELVTKYLEGSKGETFLDRPHGPAAIAEGLLFGNGETWKNNKKAFMKALHTTTFTKHLEAAIQTELAIMMNRLLRKRDTPIKIGDDLLPACTNVIAGLLLGGFLPPDCDDRKKLLKVAKNLEGVDLASVRTQVSLAHPKLRETISKLTFTDIVDMHGTHRCLQRLLRQWIAQARKGTLTPAHIPFSEMRVNAKNALPETSYNQSNAKDNELSSNSSDASATPLTCPYADKSVEFDSEQNLPDSPHSTPSNISNEESDPHIETQQQESSDCDTEAEAVSNCSCADNSNDSDVVPRKRPRIKIPTVTIESQMPGKFDCLKVCPTDDCLLTPPQDERVMEAGLRSVSFFTAYGFSETSKGELPYEIPESTPTTELPQTPLTEFKWRFQKAMSLNLQQQSILQRILDQPEFHNVTEENGNDEELLQSLIDMFFAGITSTLSALEFTLMYLSQNPLVQREAQKEIDVELEQHSGLAISWEARERMPYMRAVITEALRLGAITPSSLPHVASEDTEIEGYAIPKGRLVLASIYSMHRDPAYFIDPHVFRPQRHLFNGKFEKPESYRPYGIGARRCVGDTVAEMQLFLFTVYILMHFNVKPADSRRDPSKDTFMRIIHRLKNFKCIISLRNPARPVTEKDGIEDHIRSCKFY